MLETAFDTLPIDKISTNPARPRQTISQQALSQLADSIRQFGILNPLLVNQRGGVYHVICGERRLRAAKVAGLTDVPCMIVSVDPEELSLFNLAENLQRESLNLIDQGVLISKLHKNLNYTLIEIGQNTGLTVDEIESRLAILDLPDKIRRSYLEKKISNSEMIRLVDVSDPIQQEAIYKRLISK
ncbi:ParB/RepB/Spo0J family partition protein [candidate division WWE3 bacterium]|uniref:ParB/RepB/Spo0J family partition protein n=1 Tax=candidate division WWE3 bacterium TaxID=2053526 RepID=A0A955LWZ3_UNCKA|nr:ParB/RepB/Spo0J family partition protein [candidate division WWE3 bacterium]